jgi:hypothetical protein
VFDALDPHRLSGCSFWDGDTYATLSGAANEYCIAIQTPDLGTTSYIRDAIRARTDQGLLAGDDRFSEGDVIRREPLVHAGDVDQQGRLVVPPDKMVHESWGEGTQWTVVTRSEQRPAKPVTATDADEDDVRVADAGYSILGKPVLRVGDPAVWARDDQMATQARSALRPDDERVALALVDLLAHYSRASEAGADARHALFDEAKELGRTLCADGGSDRMKLVAFRVQVLGADHPDYTVRSYLRIRHLELMWDGVCGWQR